MFRERPVILAQRQIAIEAMLNRSPAVVKAPRPEREIFMATALAPKKVHKNEVKKAAIKENSLLLGVCSIIAS